MVEMKRDECDRKGVTGVLGIDQSTSAMDTPQRPHSPMDADRPSDYGTRRIERFLARGFIGLLSLVIGLVGLEVIGRCVLGEVKAPVEAAYPSGFLRRPRPYVMFGGTPGNGLNERGYRGPAPTSPKPDGEYRIMLLGGSTVFEGEPPIAALMEEQFHHNGHSHVRVYNCGVVSSVSGQELARIVFELADDAPDLIVMYNGGNDVLEPMHYDPRPGYPFNFLLNENNPILTGNDRPYPLVPLVAYASHVCRRLGEWRFAEAFGRLEELRTATQWKSAAWEEQIASTYVRNLEKGAKVSAAFGADFVAFFQPTLAFKDALAGAEIERSRKDAWEIATSQAIRQRIHAHAKTAMNAGVLNFVDASDVYDDVPEPVYRDFIHTVQTAKPLVAEFMERHIADLTMLRHPRSAAKTSVAQR